MKIAHILKYINKEGKEIYYIYATVREQSLRIDTINGIIHRGKKGRVTLPMKFIGKRVKVSFEIKNRN